MESACPPLRRQTQAWGQSAATASLSQRALSLWVELPTPPHMHLVGTRHLLKVTIPVLAERLEDHGADAVRASPRRTAGCGLLGRRQRGKAEHTTTEAAPPLASWAGARSQGMGEAQCPAPGELLSAEDMRQ